MPTWALFVLLMLFLGTVFLYAHVESIRKSCKKERKELFDMINQLAHRSCSATCEKRQKIEPIYIRNDRD